MRTLCWNCYCYHFNNVSQRNSEGNGYVVCNIFHLAVSKKMCSFRVWHVLKAWQWQSSITQLEFQKQNLWRSAILSLRHIYISKQHCVFIVLFSIHPCYSSHKNKCEGKKSVQHPPTHPPTQSYVKGIEEMVLKNCLAHMQIFLQTDSHQHRGCPVLCIKCLTFPEFVKHVAYFNEPYLIKHFMF